MKLTTSLLAFLALFVAPLATSRAKDWGAKESFAVVNPVARSEYAQVLSLSGEWSFTNQASQNYRLGVGEGVWGKFTYDWSTARKINVPGAWEAQGVGEPAPGRTWDCLWDCGMWDLNNVYVGRALYRRTFDVPKEWEGKRVWLKIGGVASQGYFWINAKRAAFVETYCGARKYDITPFVKPGETNEITALVRNDVPSRLGLIVVNEKFGGFFRDVEIEATPDLYVDDVWARGDVATRSADVRVYVKRTDANGQAVPFYEDELSPNDRDQLATLRANGLNVQADAGRAYSIENLGSVEVAIKTLDGQIVGRAEQKGETKTSAMGLPEPFRFSIPIQDCRLWTPEQPNLYLADVVIKDAEGKAIHGWTERFGVRELKVVGRQFFLNGKPYFLRGGGDHNYDQINLTEPPSRERFREHFKTYKEAGFNYMRFHTHSPLPEYYEIADEKGILLQPELPYYHDVTCEGFEFNPKRDMYELFRTNRRYVSFATYSYGNEGYLGSPVDVQLYNWVKTYDPDRLVIHQDGGTANRPDDSDYTTNGTSGASIINPWPTGAHDDVDRPFVAHEYLNLAIKMDPRYESRFTGVRTAPVSVDAWKKKLESVGLNEEWGAACIAASEKLQGIYQKRGLEAARIDPACDGYLFWSLVDASIPQGSCVAAQGYLNPFWEPRPNGLQPKEFYRFNGPTALLISTDREAPILVNGDKLKVEFKISHYDAESIPAGKLRWSFVGKDENGAEFAPITGEVDFDEIPAGFAGKIASAAIEIPENAVKTPSAFQFKVAIDQKVDNSWSYWIFPKREKRSLAGFAVSRQWFNAFDKLYSDVEKIDENADPNDGKIWILSPNEPEFYVAVAQGRRVFAISPASTQPNVSLGWWSLGTQVGTTFAESPAFGGFCNSNDMTELWFRLIRAGAPDLASKPLGTAFEPLAVGEGRDSYYLYLGQTKFRDASVLSSYAIDLTQDAPEATALLDSLLDYVASPAFAPKSSASSLKFTTYQTPDGSVWGFDKLVTKTGDQIQSWKTLYEEDAIQLNARQLEKGSEVVWKTKAIKDASKETTTFVFIGALGYWSEKKTEGFELSVDGVNVLKFDLPESGDAKVGEKSEWKSQDGKASLTFEVGRVSMPGPDYFGVFTLVVPTELVKNADEGATIAVKSLGEGSYRWFAVSDYPGLRAEKEEKAE